MRHFAEINGGELIPFYQIHGVYMDEGGKIDGWTEDAVAPYGDTVDELIVHLEQLLNDAKRSKDDVLDYERKEEEDGNV